MVWNTFMQNIDEIFKMRPEYQSEIVSWQGHIPFAFSLIKVLKPKIFVELGTHKGDSYLSFCQAVKQFGYDTKCFAIDTWKGDEHAGFYNDEVFDELKNHHYSMYRGFSCLIRSTFNDALDLFKDSSIDLLHIDGMHIYEAVKHDYLTWFPKVSNKGVILFHDICEKKGDFGVWKLWDELTLKYPHFSFSHSHGLGVLAVGEDVPGKIIDFCNTADKAANIIRKNYEIAGKSVAFNGLIKLIDVERIRFNEEIAIRQDRINILDSKISDTEAERDKAVAGRDTAITERDAAITERDAAIVECTDAQLALKHNMDELKCIVSSNSWRMTAPLRVIRRSMNLLYMLYRQVTSNLSRLIWRGFPMSMQSKMAIKNILFKTFPSLFEHTLAYSAWQSNKSIRGPLLKTGHAFAMDMEDENLIKQVPLLDANSLAELPVRLIAFYLPQFHPIPENDKWWGKGFTEWTNVKPATPQFVGHYQPRAPGELGYYDLRSKEVQHRQVELAKLYGIGGFCFYLYWFGGKRLLELPVQNYFENQGFDLPFCVCWANENWSRRWDGLDNEILIKQNHLPEDDLAFIEYVSIYLKDSRYIRIKGKPLLIVYQPALFPSIRKTVKRWRNWCRDNNIGDIYIAYTQSFESVNPEKYGFDGAIEFPPNNSIPPVITDLIKPLSPEFSGIVYDWNIFVERSRKYKKPDYPLFRGVCPSWDNTARRKGKAGIFYGSRPDKYGEWLENASIDTVRRFLDPSERLIFVNAWNEWAEGAYLEPDQRYGYAYLQATRDALERVNAKLNIL